MMKNSSVSTTSSCHEAQIDFEIRELGKKVHPRSVKGRFSNLRLLAVWVTQLVFFLGCWLTWNDRQAILFDIANRKFYLFHIVFWPQDIFYLALLLIVCAFGLFLFTAVAGRLWCGYSCPQTVYTEIFLWIERLIEGDRLARLRLEKMAWTKEKTTKRVSKYVLWILFSLWTGFTFVGYFTPVKAFFVDVISWEVGSWALFWFLFYSVFTFVLAGHLREQVCLHMCPYARFQSVMFDADTLIVTYDVERGEPRGPRKKTEDHRSAGKGDCIDCGLCHAVCPTDIDIRNGLQYECIGCSACIDVCDEVMEKTNAPKGLIRYSTENAIHYHWSWKDIIRHLFRPRILIYSFIFGLSVISLVIGVLTKPILRMDIIRDRAVLAREVEGEKIENLYQIQLMNISEEPHVYQVGVAGLENIDFIGETQAKLGPQEHKTLTIAVHVPIYDQQKENSYSKALLEKGTYPIVFFAKSTEGSFSIEEESTFIIPEL